MNATARGLLVLSFLSCTPDPPPPPPPLPPAPEVAFDTLESARAQAKENAVWNAQRFRQVDPRVEKTEIISRGDSTQSNQCPQGDGWATIDFIDKADKTKVTRAKCSTVSAALGCMTEDDFKGKSYAQEENHCASTNRVPFPMRKLVE